MTPRGQTMKIGAGGRAVAAKVRLLRRQRGLTTGALSLLLTEDGCQIDQSGITRIELLQRRVNVDDLVALADALGVTPAQLLEPPGVCSACHSVPPAGFACLACGAEAGL